MCDLDDELCKSHEAYMKRRMQQRNSNDKDEQQQQQQQQPKKKRRTKREKNLDFLIRSPDGSLESEYQLESASAMVRKACINIRNIDNLTLMEWSEAIMLQLCSLKMELDWALVDWINAKGILEFQWSYEVVESLHEHTGTTNTLKDILVANHRDKIDRQYIKPHQMFHKTPKINYPLLKTFYINPEIAKRLSIPAINTKRRTAQINKK